MVEKPQLYLNPTEVELLVIMYDKGKDTKFDSSRLSDRMGKSSKTVQSHLNELIVKKLVRKSHTVSWS